MKFEKRPARPPSASRFLRFLREKTVPAAPPLCPELRLRTAPDLASLWSAHEQWLGTTGVAPPFWGIVWPGGAALARYIFDHPAHVEDRVVLDFGSGCGICAIAAARAGARRVYAADIDPYSRLAIESNARLNGVRVEVTADDVCGALGWNVVLAADIWYERFLAQRVTPWLRSLAGTGATVLMGDIGRAHLPRSGLIERATYAIPTSQSLERHTVSIARVWEFRTAAPTATRL